MSDSDSTPDTNSSPDTNSTPDPDAAQIVADVLGRPAPKRDNPAEPTARDLVRDAFGW